MTNSTLPQKGGKNWELMDSFFNPADIDSIKNKLRKMKTRNVVFCSFESRFARSGGLAAVTKTILPALAQLEKIQRVLLMTPFYPHIIEESKLTPSNTAPFPVTFQGNQVTAELLEYTPGEKKIKEYYIKAPGFFTAQNPINDPYGYFPDDPDRNQAALTENALFFCKAVPLALKALGIREDIVFHLQEWQTTLIALTSKEAMLDGSLKSCGCVQTMHNPFDSWISAESLAKITDNKKIHQNREFQTKGGFTAYQMGLQLMDAPVTTVSEHFAEELTSDPLQTEHFADNLQEILKKNMVIGVNNGMFIGFPPEFPPGKDFSLDEVKKIKLAKRKALLEILDTYHPQKRFGPLTYRSGSITGLPGHVPILLMSGRLDPFQKGFDVLLRAVKKFAPDEIKVILTPMPINDSDLNYFREVASQHPCQGNITVFPIKMEKGYAEAQIGSTFGIMPSIYEPFGAAVEYMVNGTVNLARKTGGLVNQIQHQQCGFLYRENPQFYTIDNIKDFAEANDVVHTRDNNPWVQSMADELYNTIKEAATMYRERPEEYYRMVLNGFKQAQTFTWERAAKAYFEIYKYISS